MEIERGFYYHIKHNPEKGIFDAAYEYVGSGWNADVTGDDTANFLSTEMAIYRPVFRSSLIEKNGRDFWMRPINNFLEKVERDGQLVSRFQRITDPAVIAELAKLRDEMYN